MGTETERLDAPAVDEDDDDREEFYPGDVEEAMPEGELSYDLANYVKSTIALYSADLERDSVHANMPIYYQRGTRQLVAPDAFFVRGVPYDRNRRSWRLWKSKVRPQVVFEIVSEGHEKKDVDVNRFLFEKLGFPEYYWFNPATQVLMALELDPATEKYRERKPSANGRHRCEILGLEVGLQNGLIALYHKGQYVPPPLELIERVSRERDEAARERDEAARERDEAARERDEATRERDEATRARDRVLGELAEERRRREDLERRIREIEGR